MRRRGPCKFCLGRARYVSQGLRFCSWHVLWFYFALYEEWTA